MQRRVMLVFLVVAGMAAATPVAAEAPAAVTVAAPPVVGVGRDGSASFSVVVTNAGAGKITGAVGIVGPDGELPESIEIVPQLRNVKMEGRGSQTVTFRVTSYDSTKKAVELHAVVESETDGGPAEHRDPFTLVFGAEAPTPTQGSSVPALAAALALGAGVGGAAGGAMLWLRRVDWPWLRGAAAFALYSRIRRSAVLDHAKRSELLRLIEARPGIRFSELRQEARLPNGTLYHHLRKLEEAELIASVRSGRSRRYVLRGAELPEENTLSPGEAELLATIPPEGITVRELAERLHLTRQGAAYRIRSLAAKGFVVRRLVRAKWRWFCHGQS